MSDAAQVLQRAVTADATGRPIQPSSPRATLQATIAGSGSVSATVTIYASNIEPANGIGQFGIVLGTIALSGTDAATDGFTMDAPWKWVWSDIADITGDDASVDVVMGL